MFDTITDDATLHSFERGTASLPDIAGDAVRFRLSKLLRRPLRDEPTSSVARGVFAITVGVAAMIWPDVSLGAMLVVFGAYALVDATLAITTAVANPAYRGRLIAQALVDVTIVIFAIAQRDFTRTAALTLLAVWVVVMGALRVRDAITFGEHGVHVNVVLVALAMLAITAGASAIVAPDDHLQVVIINVWIFTILRGVMLIVAARHQEPAIR